MIKTILSLLFVTFLSAIPARAFDFASIEIIGFSADGNTFTFEQYGEQDGSGFPYSDIFVIDTHNDKWIKGSPFRVLIENEDATIAKARKINRDNAAAALVSISDKGIIAATNRVDELNLNPYQITVKPKSFFFPDNIDQMTFQTQNLNLEASQTCKSYDLGTDFAGFRLTRTGRNDAIEHLVMHEDKAIPDSRNCPFDYQPETIVFHISDEGKFTVAVIVRMETIGFEGSDRRYLAVTGAIN